MNRINILNPNLYSSCSEDKLVQFEKALGETLPSSYRDFILSFNGGTPDPAFFWIEKGVEGTEINQFYGLYESPKGSSLNMFLGDDHCGVPNGFLSIADDGVGNSVIICLAGPHRGSIHFIDHEIHPYHQRNSFEGITKLAESFSGFASLVIASPG
jgi:hypothetical protein